MSDREPIAPLVRPMGMDPLGELLHEHYLAVLDERIIEALRAAEPPFLPLELRK